MDGYRHNAVHLASPGRRDAMNTVVPQRFCNHVDVTPGTSSFRENTSGTAKLNTCADNV
jgi:hypothetical protein